jgi:hypothetical protein
MAQNIIDLINCGNGVQQMLPAFAYTSGTQGVTFNLENLTDTVNVILSVGSVNVYCSGLQCWLEETQFSGGSPPAGQTGLTGTQYSGWYVVSGCSFPATSGAVLGTTASGGSAVSGNVYIGRGLRQFQYARMNLSTFNQVGVQSGQAYLSAVLVSQGKFTGTSGASLAVNAAAGLSGTTGFTGAGTDRYPST